MYALTHHDRSTARPVPKADGPLEYTNHYPYPDTVVPFFNNSGERDTALGSLNAG